MVRRHLILALCPAGSILSWPHHVICPLCFLDAVSKTVLLCYYWNNESNEPFLPEVGCQVFSHRDDKTNYNAISSDETARKSHKTQMNSKRQFSTWHLNYHIKISNLLIAIRWWREGWRRGLTLYTTVIMTIAIQILTEYLKCSMKWTSICVAGGKNKSRWCYKKNKV